MNRLLVLATLGSVLGAAVAEEPLPGDYSVTIWDGVYTDAQAQRGEDIYPAICGRCHGRKLDGAPDDPDFFPAPPIAGPKFLRQWSGISLAALFEYTRTTMPAINPGSLSDQEFVDVLSFMLAATGAPAGENELEVDSVASVLIAGEP